MTRKMAKICEIDKILPIPDADAIEVAFVGGWAVVVKKGEFREGMRAVYCEIDSWIPHKLAPYLSKGKEPREFEGIQGERLRTIKLRGQLSQGLLLNLDHAIPWTNSYHLDDDVSEVLGIVKWEKPMNAQLAGVCKGNFPSLIPKTDQERVQNLKKEIKAAFDSGLKFEVTEKLEGSSMTVYQMKGEFGVCSRNMDLKETEGNSFWSTARRDAIQEKMAGVDEYWDFAIQGELVGPGIQGNIYKLSQPEFYVYDVYNIQAGEYLNPQDRERLVKRMGLKHVPIQWHSFDVAEDIEAIIAQADGRSWLNKDQDREGIVFKQVDGGMTFKAISNKYLLGEK